LNRGFVIDQLRNVQVFKADKVVVEWALKLPGGDTIYGRADSGRVQLSSNKQKRGIQIFLAGDDIESLCPPLELEEELSKFCGINSPSHVGILQYILIQSDLETIHHTLQRRGIHDIVPEFDDEIQGEFLLPVAKDKKKANHM